MQDVSYNQLIQIISSAQYIIADRYFVSLYPKIKEQLHSKLVFYVDSPEKSKSVEVYAKAIDYFLDHNISRSNEILIVGGGATSDFGGFVASTILRGVKWSVIPTTLLSMVDAAIGGKVGINTKAGKNLIGNFHHPENIYYHYDLLKTLSKVEFDSGLGEIVKYAFLEKQIFDAINTSKDISEISKLCSKFKTEIVATDFKESGARKILNLGHSFGHAFEKTAEIPHGNAVLIGLKLILSLYAPHLISDYNRVVKNLELEVTFEPVHFKEFSEYVKQDKKTHGDLTIELIIPLELGKVKIEKRNINHVLSEVAGHESFKTYFC